MGAPFVISAAPFLLMFPHKRHINAQPIRFPHRFIGGDDAAKDVGEGPLRLQSRIGVPEVKQEERCLVWSRDPGAQGQHALHEVRHRRHAAQLPEDRYRVLSGEREGNAIR